MWIFGQKRQKMDQMLKLRFYWWQVLFAVAYNGFIVVLGALDLLIAIAK